MIAYRQIFQKSNFGTKPSYKKESQWSAEEAVYFFW